MKSYVFLLSVLFGTSAIAGSSSVEIKCTTASKRTEIHAVVPGDSAEAWLKVTVDGKSQVYLNNVLVQVIELNNGNASEQFPGYIEAPIATFDRWKQGVFAVSVLDAKNHFSLVDVSSVAGTMKLTAGEYGSRQGSFKAVGQTLDPRKAGAWLVDLALTCTYDYSI